MLLTERLIAHAIHEAKESLIETVVVGPHWTVVALNDGRTGMASTLPDDYHCGSTADIEKTPNAAQHVIGKPTKSLFLDLSVTTGKMRGVLWAAVNACVAVSSDHEGIVELNAKDLLIEKSPDKVVAFIGRFGFAKKIKSAKQLMVFEMFPEEGEFSHENAAAELPKADVVGITGSTIVNRTIDGLLDHIRPDAFVVVFGQSTTMSPILLDHVNCVAGVIVTDSQALIRTAGQTSSECQEGLQGISKCALMRE